MANQNNHYKATNFWFGFSLGVLTCGTGLYLFGTKGGRHTLKKLLELTENLEENLITITKDIDNMSHESNNHESTKQIVTTIGTIINKVKSFSPLAK